MQEASFKAPLQRSAEVTIVAIIVLEGERKDIQLLRECKKNIHSLTNCVHPLKSRTESDRAFNSCVNAKQTYMSAKELYLCARKPYKEKQTFHPRAACPRVEMLRMWSSDV